jgi:hypothetical protein
MGTALFQAYLSGPVINRLSTGSKNRNIVKRSVLSLPAGSFPGKKKENEVF